MSKRKTTQQEQEVFQFLNGLRDSGATNMFGARSYIQEEFPNLSQQEATSLLALWMDNFQSNGKYEEINV